jgi:hypothetical protein
MGELSAAREDVTISVERMMRFCHLVQMQFEFAAGETQVLPLHLTRFGTLVFETASFLYSLFDDRVDSINLVQVWRGFDHPFAGELANCEARLLPFKEELRLVRNRLGFHGSLDRAREQAGLGIFDTDSPRAQEFVRIVRDVQRLCLRMIEWYMKGMDESAQAEMMWTELERYSQRG